MLGGQFLDAVASPTTFPRNVKDCDASRVLPVRNGRSQSLSTLSRRASTASVLTIETTPCDTLLSHEEETELEQHQRVRHARRALSSGTGSSLSLLQEELGYPRWAQVATEPHRHRRGGSLFETMLESRSKENKRGESNHEETFGRDLHSRSSSCSSSVASTSDMLRTQSVPELEPEHPAQIRRSGTCHSTTCSPRRDAVGEDEDVQDDDDDDDNFMNYRSASVTGYSRDTDGVVYYEVIVRSIVHGPLSAYKVRRRYSEFRDLHVALRKVMVVSHRKFASATAMASISDESNNNEDEDADLRCAALDGSDGQEPTLPPLPDKGGLWSCLLFDSIPLLERRAKYFHAMLTAAQRHPMARASRLLNDFVGTPPDLVSMHSSVENSYVSLNRFAAPKLSFDIEIQERKEKAKSIRRRRSSLKRQSFTGSLDASFTSLHSLQ